MKSLVLFVLFLILSTVSFSQSQVDSSTLISGIDVVKLRVSDMMVLKGNTVTENVDSLYLLKHKKQTNPFFYFYIDVVGKTIMYSKREYHTKLGFIRKIKSSENNITFDYIAKGNINYYVKIDVDLEGKVNLLIIQTNKNGKTKVYFSNECKLEKVVV
jgi:hypothetical protein